MPWTPETFKKKHNHSLTEGQAKRASAQANAILRKTGDEKLAISVANKDAKAKPKPKDNPFSKAVRRVKKAP